MKTISAILLVVVLAGCAGGPKIVDKRPDPVVVTHQTLLAYDCPPPPTVDKFKARDITWDVISREQLVAVLSKLLSDAGIEGEPLLFIDKQTGDFIFQPGEETIWGLTADEYADLGRNTSDILAAVKQLRKVVDHYKSCIDKSKAAVEAANAAENEKNKNAK